MPHTAHNTPSNDQNSDRNKWGAIALLAMTSCLSALGVPGCSGSRRVGNLESATSFTAQQDRFTLGTDLTLYSAGEALGTVQQYRVALREGYALYDGEGKQTASAVKRALSWGTVIDIYDEKGKKLGMVSEKVLDSKLSWTSTYYEITNSKDEVVADSKKSDILGTGIQITSPAGEPIAIISRSALDMGKDTWSISITGDIDRKLIVFIPSFKTHSDDAKSSKKKSK